MAKSYTMADTMSHSNSSWVDSLAIIDHLGNISVYIVGVVVDCLRAAVREGDGVGSLPGGGAIVSLGGREVGAGESIGHSVLVGVGDGLSIHLVDTVGYTVTNTVTDTVTNNPMTNTMADTPNKSMSHTMAKNTMTNTMGDTTDKPMSNTMADHTMTNPPNPTNESTPTNKPMSKTTNNPMSNTTNKAVSNTSHKAVSQTAM